MILQTIKQWTSQKLQGNESAVWLKRREDDRWLWRKLGKTPVSSTLC